MEKRRKTVRPQKRSEKELARIINSPGTAEYSKYVEELANAIRISLECKALSSFYGKNGLNWLCPKKEDRMSNFSGYRASDFDNTEIALVDILTATSPKTLKKTLLKELTVTNQEYDTARYIAWIVAKLHLAGLMKDKELFRAAKTIYDQMMADKIWFDLWDDKKKLMSELHKEYKLFQKTKAK